MFDSVHFAKWVEATHSAVRLVLLPASPHRSVHQNILRVAKENPNVILLIRSPLLSVPLFLIDKILVDRLKALVIAYYIRKYSPAITHAHQIQYAGYAASLAATFCDYKKPLIVCCWGSELTYYKTHLLHAKRIGRTLRAASHFQAECNRDNQLATQLGFSGDFLSTFPISGGFDDFGSPGATRNLVMVKGYQGKWGAGLVALVCAQRAVLETNQRVKIVVFSAPPVVRLLARLLALTSGVDIASFGKGKLSNQEMLALFKKSIAYLSVSRADGIGTTGIEALSQGAIPLQAPTSCLQEWIPEEIKKIQFESIRSKEIVRALNSVLAMSEAELLEIRREAISFAKRYMDRSSISSARSLEYARILKEHA